MHAVSMPSDNHRDDLVRLVTTLMAGQGTEAEQDAALGAPESRVPHPRVSALIFWPHEEGFDRELTPDEVVDIALN